MSLVFILDIIPEYLIKPSNFIQIFQISSFQILYVRIIKSGRFLYLSLVAQEISRLANVLFQIKQILS